MGLKPEFPEIDHCRKLVIALAPEFEGREPYIVNPWDLALVGYPISNKGGWATSDIDPSLRALMIDRGLWRGVRPTIYINATAIEDGDLFAAMSLSGLATERPNRIYVATLQTFLHELSHCLPAPEDRPEPARDSWAIREYARESYAEWIKRPPVQEFPWGDADEHGWRFIRRCLHLHIRALLIDEPSELDGLCAGSRYGLSPPDAYLEALQGEPKALLRATFATIEATKAPASFMQLWRDDVATFEKSRVVAAEEIAA